MADAAYNPKQNIKKSHSKEKEAKIMKIKEDLFNGAISARSDVKKSFQDLEFIPNSSNRPAIVFPDGHIFLETYSPFYNKVIDFIVAIAEPCSRPKYMQEYQITSYSLFAAVSIGLSGDEIIRVLQLISKTPITEEFKEYLKDRCNSVGRLKLVLKEQRYFIEAKEQSLLQDLLRRKMFKEIYIPPQEGDRLAKDPRFILVDEEETDAIISGVGEASFYGSVQRMTEGFDDSGDFVIRKKPSIMRFEIKAESIMKVREYAVQEDLFMSDEYDFVHDTQLKNLGIGLRPETSVRPYQEKALAKMFSNGRAKSGIIVLPCGAGKTLVGITVVSTIDKPAVIVCNSVEPVKQWQAQFKKWTTINPNIVITLTSGEKKLLPDGPCIIITTYGMLTANSNRSERAKRVIEQIKTRDWGILVMDEVQEAAAKTFRNVTELVHAHTRLGLTATMVREDGKIEDLKYLVGPKLYEANWIELSESGYLARVKCYEITVPMTAAFYKEYIRLTKNTDKETDDRFLSYITSAANPNKMNVLDDLLQFHESRGDKILVFCDYVALINTLASRFNRAVITGEVTNNERTMLFNKFKNGNKINTIFISRVGDKAIDLPAANVLIQMSSLFGARMVEAQRLGRILRPKPGRQDEYNAFFYTIVSDDTSEVFFSAKRQQFLVDQGFSYEPVTNPLERWPPSKPLIFSTKESQDSWLEQIKSIKDDDSHNVDAERKEEDLDAMGAMM